MVFPGPLNHRTHPPGLQAVVAHFRVGPGLNCAWWEGDMVTSSTSTSSHPRSLWKKCQNCPTTRGQTILDISKEMHCSIQKHGTSQANSSSKKLVGGSATHPEIMCSIWIIIPFPKHKCLCVCVRRSPLDTFGEMYVCMYVMYVCLSAVCLPAWLAGWLSVCLYVHGMCMVCAWYVHASIYLSICACIYISIYLSTYLSIDLSIYRSIHLSIYPSIHLSIYPSIHLCIYVSIYLSIYLLSIYLIDLIFLIYLIYLIDLSIYRSIDLSNLI